MEASSPPDTHIFISMALQGVPPHIQAHIYGPHPHSYHHANPHYNGQSGLYAYGTQQTTQTPPLAAPPDVEHPTQVTSEETKPSQSSKAAARRLRQSTWKGRMSGSQNWSAQDLIALAHYVEGDVPLGMNVWKRIEGLYNKDYAIPNNRQEHTWDNMRDKWYKVM